MRSIQQLRRAERRRGFPNGGGVLRSSRTVPASERPVTFRRDHPIFVLPGGLPALPAAFERTRTARPRSSIGAPRTALCCVQNRCRGYQECVRGCPDKKVFCNPMTGTSEKCVACYPKMALGIQPQCVVNCIGKMRLAGFISPIGRTPITRSIIWCISTGPYQEGRAGAPLPAKRVKAHTIRPSGPAPAPAREATIRARCNWGNRSPN